MKIALLGDTHFGARNDNSAFHDYFEKFYTEIFFPYLVENKIDTVVTINHVISKATEMNLTSQPET